MIPKAETLSDNIILDPEAYFSDLSCRVSSSE
jgi:hypothetical protein